MIVYNYINVTHSYAKITRKEYKTIFNEDRLRLAVFERKMTIRQFCEAIEMVPKTFYAKLNRGGDFNRDEIAKMSEVLDLDDVRDIFFENEVADTKLK